MSRRLVLLALLAGCRGSTGAHIDAAVGRDAAMDAAGDARMTDADIDGVPVREPCTDTFGTALTTSSYGRLDGYLVAIIPTGPSGPPCNADNDHVHLQVRMSGAVYDIAVNVGTNDTSNNVHTTTIEHALIGSAWSEGWHTEPAIDVDYVALGVHSTAIPLEPQAQTVAALTADLASVNHVSIYATAFSASGAHLVHRNNGLDGLIVTHPLSPVAHARLFSFSTQTF
ncbi:MAG TPA: hypothetical protein VFT22_22765 [Kofleriaceae bacterium]|nr:hypothetical protein [Kofleriaceae bacterium]